MNGIQSLLQGPQGGPQQAPGQAQPPGQAPMPGMQQQQGPQRDVPSIVKQLQQSLNPAQLQALVQQSKAKPTPDGYAALAALFSALKRQQLAQAAQGANAQQQAQQQQGTVADQILQMAQQQQPVMAAHGGMMRGYSGGGIVAFSNGGGATSYPVEDQPWWKSLPADALLRRTMEAYRKLREPEEGPRKWEEAVAEEPDLLGETLVPPPEEVDVGQAPRTTVPGKTGDPDVDIGPKVGLPAAAQLAGQAARAKTPPTPATPPAGQKPPARPGIASLVEDEIRRREGTRTLPPELVAAQERLAKAAERDVQLRNEEMRAARTSAERARDEAMQRASGMGAEGYFKLAAFLGGAKKGEVVKKLGEGLGEEQARQRLGREAASKAFAEFEKTERQANELTRRIENQELQRQVAVEQGKFDRAMAIDKEIANLRFDLDKTLQDRADKAEELRLKGITAEAAKTTAGRETEAQQRERLLRTDPLAFAQLYGKQDKSYAFDALKKQADLVIEANKDPLLDKSIKDKNNARLEQIYQALASLSGVGQQSQILTATNPQTKERIMSTDGGKTWQPVK